METAESIYEGVVEPSYKKSTRADSNRAGHSRQILGEAAPSKTYSEMIKISDKGKQRYVDFTKV